MQEQRNMSQLQHFIQETQVQNSTHCVHTIGLPSFWQRLSSVHNVHDASYRLFNISWRLGQLCIQIIYCVNHAHSAHEKVTPSFEFDMQQDYFSAWMMLISSPLWQLWMVGECGGGGGGRAFNQDATPHWQRRIGVKPAERGSSQCFVTLPEVQKGDSASVVWWEKKHLKKKKTKPKKSSFFSHCSQLTQWIRTHCDGSELGLSLHFWPNGSVLIVFQSSVNSLVRIVEGRRSTETPANSELQ